MTAPTDPRTRARQLIAAATPGPWTYDKDHRTLVSVDGEAWEAIAVETPTTDVAMVWAVDEARDAALIAAAPQLIAELCDALDAATDPELAARLNEWCGDDLAGVNEDDLRAAARKLGGTP